MNPYPVLISIPHGGTEVPPEIADRVCITPKDQFQDSDALTREIYSISDQVQVCLEGTIARAFVDLNRDVSDRPPENPDGIVKTMTCLGQPIYHPGQELNDELTELLIEKYHAPYHQSIRTALDTRNDLELMLDCHTMEAVGPKISPDSGQARPLFCLGSQFGKSCPEEMVQRMARCIQTAFDLKEDDVTINKPFAGGYITRTYGNHPVPCIQIEMSRQLYLAEPWFDLDKLKVTPDRLVELKTNFIETLKLFFL